MPHLKPDPVARALGILLLGGQDQPPQPVAVGAVVGRRGQRLKGVVGELVEGCPLGQVVVGDFGGGAG